MKQTPYQFARELPVGECRKGPGGKTYRVVQVRPKSKKAYKRWQYVKSCAHASTPGYCVYSMVKNRCHVTSSGPSSIQCINDPIQHKTRRSCRIRAGRKKIPVKKKTPVKKNGPFTPGQMKRWERSVSDAFKDMVDPIRVVGEGKDGIVFVVKLNQPMRGVPPIFVVKVFKHTKPVNRIRNEARYQMMAADVNACVPILFYEDFPPSASHRALAMPMLESTCRQMIFSGEWRPEHTRKLISVLQNLGKIGLNPNDELNASRNIMVSSSDEVFVIDYGFACRCKNPSKYARYDYLQELHTVFKRLPHPRTMNSRRTQEHLSVQLREGMISDQFS